MPTFSAAWPFLALGQLERHGALNLRVHRLNDLNGNPLARQFGLVDEHAKVAANINKRRTLVGMANKRLSRVDILGTDESKLQSGHVQR